MSTEPPSLKEILLQSTAQELGTEALETVVEPKIVRSAIHTIEELPSAPVCITQDSTPQNLANHHAIMIGRGSSIPRWTPGSVIRWSAWRMGYESQEDADHAALHLSIAADIWNEAEVGVRFEFVPLAKDANFVVCHGGYKGDVLASAYFPNQKDLNFVYVYTRGLAPDWKDSLWSVFVHELGHVLGLRHEFAMDPRRLERHKAVQFGEANPLSVMNYRREPPELQPSDIAATRAFYQMPAGTMLESTPVVDFVPQ
ncbi:hypothetical protein N7451_011526 [Penicillium sp. IBT 35674x]|nr:hypothetical protein N7451_011526 [Penicillium sp. IBT 35674x]